GNLIEARALLAELVREQPNFAPALVSQARLLLAENATAEAVALLTKATELDPFNLEAFYWKAQAHYAREEYVQGDAALASATQIDARHPRVRLLQAQRLLADRKLGAAGPLIETYVREFPADPDGLLTRSDYFALAGNYAEAERQLDALIPEGSGWVLPFARARLAYLRGEYRTVIDLTTPLVTLAAPSWRVLYLRAAALGRLGRFRDGITLLQPYLDLPESKGHFYKLVGDLYHLSGDVRAAESTYIKGLTAYPGNPRLLEGVSRVAVDTERWVQAREWAEAGAEKDSPYKRLFLERLVLVYRRLNRPAQAQEILQRLLADMDPLVTEGRDPADQAILFGTAQPPLGVGMRPPAAINPAALAPPKPPAAPAKTP
ncbi:MAG: tetratricopeptide repeat protein, partial [Candidatus Lambdaproteobacteria bacterium]|nr:tetratricopeptide repeat protein [Candidatus Lambdaproteobacteria bacterium]